MDLNSHQGYVAFLRMNEAGLAAMQGRRCAPAVAAMRADLLLRLRQDLATMEEVPLPDMAEPAADLAPLAIDYVLSGSRLGGVVLRQRWEAGPLAREGAASSFMTASDYLETWRAFCATARDLPATGAMADQIVADAATVFAVFLRSAQAASAGRSEVNA